MRKKRTENVAALRNLLTDRGSAILWFLGIAYKIALDTMYAFAASPQYQTGGLILDFVLWKFALATVMYFTIFAMLPKEEKDTVGFLLHLQFVITVAPMLTFYSLSNASTEYMIAIFGCILLQIMLVKVPARDSRTIYLKGIRRFAVAALGIMAVYSLVSIVIANGFVGLRAFDLEYIYEMRRNFVYPAGVGYFVNWLTKAVIPFVLLYALERKKYWFAALCVVTQTVFYILTGQKITLLILIPVVFVYYCARTGHLLELMYLGLTLASVAVTVIWQLSQRMGWSVGNTLCSLYAIRTFFHPADNKFNYFECFSQLPKSFFSDGQIGAMLGLTYPYAGSLGQVVYAYLGGDFLAANFNAGYLADAYAQCGYPGMVAVSLLLVFLLRSLRGYDKDRNKCLLVALFSVYFIVLNDGALLTTMFTGGFLIAYALVIIFLGERKESGYGV